MDSSPKPALISATEISGFVYCPEQWRLQYGLGLKPQNNAALDAGTRHHERKAVGVTRPMERKLSQNQSTIIDKNEHQHVVRILKIGVLNIRTEYKRYFPSIFVPTKSAKAAEAKRSASGL